MALDETTVASSAILDTVGNISYNGVTFGPLTETLSFSVRPVYDQAGRTVIYRLYSMTLKGRVFSDIPVSQTITGTLTNGSDSVTGLSSTNFPVQSVVTGTGIPANTAVSKVVSGSEILLSALATASGAQSLTFVTTTDEDMYSLRARLLQNGGELLYQRKGIGRILINNFGAAASIVVDPTAEASYVDVMWGPKPQLLSWKPRGSRGAAEAVWSVEFAIPDCPVNNLQAKKDFELAAVLEWNFRVNWNNDRSGFTRRTITGFIRVAGYRLPEEEVDAAGTGTGELKISRKLPHSADYYRELVMPGGLAGFRREGNDWTVDESKCRLDYSIVDTEMPDDIPPEGVIDVTASHSVRTTRPGFVSWEATLTATYEMARGWPKQDAWKHFQALLKSRQAAAGNALSVLRGAKVVYIPVSFSVVEPNLYGRSVTTLTMTYTFVTALKNLVGVSGLWKPVPNSDWKKWSASLKRQLGPRGNARLFFNHETDEAIVDICDPVATTTEAKHGKTVATGVKVGPTTVPPFPTTLADLSVPIPPAESSWLRWDNRLRFEDGEEIAVLKPLPVSDKLVHTVESIVQNRAAPTVVLIMEGWAARAGHQITPPSLESLAAVPTDPANRTGHEGFHTWVWANWGGVPIHVARWRMRFVLKKPPVGEFRIPLNGMLEATQANTPAAKAADVVRPTRTMLLRAATALPVDRDN